MIIKRKEQTQKLLKNYCTIYKDQLENGAFASENDVERLPGDLELGDRLSVDTYLMLLFDSFTVSDDRTSIHGTSLKVLDGPTITIQTFPNILTVSKDGEECSVEYVDNIGIADYLNII